MADLADVQRNWEIYARSDPMWGVLMDPGRRGGRWDAEAFFAAGRQEVATVLEHVSGRGVVPDFGGSALDFGCGVGRLTQALAGRFATAWGVDISPTMVELAAQLNRHPETCRYVVNASDDLARFEDGTFAFVYTSIVLQHVEPRYSSRYLAEFARLLAPGGVLVFQIPDRTEPGRTPRERLAHLAERLRRTVGLRTRTRRALRRAGLLSRPVDTREAAAEMHALDEASVRRVVEGAGLRLVDVQLTNSIDPDFVGGLTYLTQPPTVGWVSKQYCAVRPPAR
jgi:SAM-dependent methyltransferase